MFTIIFMSYEMLFRVKLQSSVCWDGILPRMYLLQITAQGVIQHMRPMSYQIISPCLRIKSISIHISSNFHMHELALSCLSPHELCDYILLLLQHFLTALLWNMNVVFSLFHPLSLKPMQTYCLPDTFRTSAENEIIQVM